MTAGRRTAGDVYVRSSADDPIYSRESPRSFSIASVDSTTSGGVMILSVNTSGATQFGVTNFGSINVYVEGSFNGIFYVASIPVTRVMPGVAGAPTSTVECVSASTIAKFDGPFAVVRVYANSGSGVYRAALSYR